MFTAVWALDAARWWLDPERYRRSSAATTIVLHGFFLFMIVNGAVVFEGGTVGVLGAVVCFLGAVGVALALRRRRRDG